jgi:3-hydroxymyristoyl/3-hydroxydecanoyl-(acyl carrier protein) dehydratase
MKKAEKTPYSLDLESLVGQDPKNLLLHHGTSKRMVDEYLFHSPNIGIVASYTPTAENVKDHFNVFRGVDQIESFAQASTCSCSIFLQCKKQNLLPEELKDLILPYFISIGNVNFHSYLEKGDTFIHVANIKFYKFRQMVCDGRTYKVPKGLDLHAYFKDYTKEQLLNYDLSEDFSLITEYFDITGRGIKLEKLKK